jgi:methylmalonyl-CoA/ethylmalonyl-CoA epimerase
MRITRIDHVAVCVRDLDAALPPWLKLLGLVHGPREFVEAQKTEALFVLTPEEEGACIELIAPASKSLGGNAGLEKFLERNQGRAGLHHIAFAVEDLAGALRELDAAGVPLIDKTPRPGARGHEVGFLHPKAADGVLVELVSDHAHAHSMGRH